MAAEDAAAEAEVLKAVRTRAAAAGVEASG